MAGLMGPAGLLARIWKCGGQAALHPLAAAVSSPTIDRFSVMYLVKGLTWRSLAQLTQHIPDRPAWTSLSEYPVKQLTTTRLGEPRVFYLPQDMQMGIAARRTTRLAA